MPADLNARLRRVWLNIHLWIGLGLALLLVPIGLSGSFLVWHDHFDAVINPARYAVTGGSAVAPSALLASAGGVLESGFQPIVLRLPEGAGWPATVMAREQRGPQATGRPRLQTVYLDPPTGRVLDVVDTRSTLVNFLHRFHENLTIPEYSGRAIVGWVGVAMLILSLSGIYLWWPRSAGFRRGLRWRRGPALSFNLHHLIGFWIALPLAVVSATGIYLGFPQQARELLSSVAPMTQQRAGGFNAQLLRPTRLGIDEALAAAVAAEPTLRPAAVFMPLQPTQSWRVQLRSPDSEGVFTVLVDDRSSAASKVPPLSGDLIARWIRVIHEGGGLGPVWQVLVFVCGLVPTLFAVTGLMIWLRSRRSRAGALAGAKAARLEAAE